MTLVACEPTPDPTPDTPGSAFVLTTHTYKVADGVELAADVYRASDELIRPVLVWIHGGALMFGSRQNPPDRLLNLCELAGCTVVSIDYRLAPSVKLPAIIDDLLDAFTWIKTEGPDLFRADLSRIVVTGGSAGGYLTLVSGYLADPKPAALVSYWGYGALDTFDAEPSEYYRSVAPLVTAEEAWSEGGNLYLYSRQQGLWTKIVTGFDPVTQRDELNRYAPVHNVGPDYPPIMLVHGTSDTDVPYSESVDMAEALAKAGVAHDLILVSDAPHGLYGGPVDSVSKALGEAMTFVYRHMFGQDPDERIERLIAASALYDRGVALARSDSILEAKDAYERALSLEPQLRNGLGWIVLCRRGSFAGFGTELLDVCDRAVESAVSSPRQAAWVRDRRGVVRAMAGDLQGSIADFEAYLAAEAGDSAARALRSGWIRILSSGENPFTTETERRRVNR